MLDPEQNHGFRDHFLNLPFNLSRVLFIATANEIEPVPRPLRDRVELLEMTGYTVEEKVQIARRHLLPKQLGLHGLTSAQLSLADETLDLLISRYTREAGVRELERLLGALCRSVAVKVAEAAEGEGAAAADGAAAEAAAAAEGAAPTTRGGGGGRRRRRGGLGVGVVGGGTAERRRCGGGAGPSEV